MAMHRILQRQIERALGHVDFAGLQPPIQMLLQTISDTYTHADEDRALMSRSLDLSSKEFVEINKRLAQENEIIEKTVLERTQELRLEKVKLDSITAHMYTGAILIDVDKRPTYINHAAESILREATTENAVTVAKTVFPTVDFDKNIDSGLAGSSSFETDIDSDGRIFSILFSPLKSETESFGVLIWITDITEQKMLDRAKDQFIAIASHEMRTPLAIIRGNAELMLDDEHIKQNNELLNSTQSILKGSVRLLGIVNDFLDLQNLESNHLSLKIESTDIIKSVSDVVRDLQGLSNEKRIYLVLRTPDTPPPCLQLDRARLQQICINLISNAIHYTATGGVTVTVEQQNDTVKILVTDTGAGIEIEDQARLFKKFATAKMFLRTKEYGSGLGLYIARLLANAMHCEVRLEKSIPKEGSTFSLTIPLTFQELK